MFLLSKIIVTIQAGFEEICIQDIERLWVWPEKPGGDDPLWGGRHAWQGSIQLVLTNLLKPFLHALWMNNREKMQLNACVKKVFASNGDILVGSEFNFPMINILWQIVAANRSILITFQQFFFYFYSYSSMIFQRFDEGNPRDMRIMESVTSTFKEGLILFYTLVTVPADKGVDMPFFHGRISFPPSFTRSSRCFQTSRVGRRWGASATRWVTSSGRSLAIVIAVLMFVIGVAVVWVVVHQQLYDANHHHNDHHQVIDQHKVDFNPDNLRDFIDMFLLEVCLYTTCV